MTTHASYSFSVCLMNPPYMRSKHLEFLSKAIELSDTTVSIQPVRWLQDPTAKYSKRSDLKKYEYDISSHIKDLEFVSGKDAEKIFGAVLNMDLAIYLCDKNGGYDYKHLNEDRIFDHVMSRMKDNLKNHIKFSEPKNAVAVSLITGGNNGRTEHIIDIFYTFKKNSTEIQGYENFIYDENGRRLDNGLTFRQNREKTAWGNVQVRGAQYNVHFDTIEECINFFNYTRLDLFRYIFNKSLNAVNVHVHPDKLPFMPSYKKPWTNEMLYDYFEIDEHDRTYITKYVNDEFNSLKERVQEDNAQKKKKKQ